MPEDVTGIEELMANFQRVIDAAIGEPVVQAGVAGADVIAAEANTLAPGPHNAILIRVAAPDNALLYIGPDKEHWYYRFIEFGVQPHTIGTLNRMALAGGGLVHPIRQVEHGGFAARPFLRPAIDNKGDAVLGAMSRRYWQGITEKLP